MTFLHIHWILQTLELQILYCIYEMNVNKLTLELMTLIVDEQRPLGMSREWLSY